MTFRLLGLVLTVLALTASPAWAVATAPTLPQATVDTTLPAVTGATFTVNAGGNLQAAINSAAAADPTLTHQVVIQAGATFQAPAGGFLLPSRGAGSGWVILRSSAEASLPAEGNRVFPSDSSNMPEIVSPTSSATAIGLSLGAHRYRLIGLHVRGNPSFLVGNLLSFDTGNRFIVDRCYLHGDLTDAQPAARGVVMNTIHVAVINSYLSHFWHDSNDTQAILSTNSAGPLLIDNNYLEAAGENVMFGGGDPSSAANIPQDATITRNHFSKPLTWRRTSEGGTTWDGVIRLNKNLFELKLGLRVLVERNLFEQNWAAQQAGWPIVFTVRNADGGASFSEVSDITFRYNVIRHAAGGWVFFADSDVPGRPTATSHRWAVHDNLWYDITDAWDHGVGSLGQFVLKANSLTGPGTDLSIRHNTIINNGPAAGFTDGKWQGSSSEWINNIGPNDPAGINSQGAQSWTAGSQTVNNGFGGTFTEFRRNALIASPTVEGFYSGHTDNFQTPSGMPSSYNGADPVGFQDYPNSDFRLAAGSRFKNAGTDGKDIGADIDVVESVTVGAGYFGATSGAQRATDYETEWYAITGAWPIASTAVRPVAASRPSVSAPSSVLSRHPVVSRPSDGYN